MAQVILNADELFFSRVEARYSDTNRSGYQVVYSTPTVTSEEVDAIEERVQCFNGGDVDQRYQFSPTPTGRYAIIKSEALAEIDRDITDRNGRGGAFVAHCYVISAEDFRKIDNNPFTLLNEDPDVIRIKDRETIFELTAQGMVAIKEKAQPTVQIHVRSNSEVPDVSMLEQWNVDKFQQLVMLGLSADKYMEEGYSVSLASDNSTTLRELISVLLYAVPPEQRIHCSFDTFVDGCLSRPGIVWLLGGEKTVRNAKVTRVDVETGDIDNAQEFSEVDNLHPKYKPLLNWLVTSLQSSSIKTVMTSISDAQQIADAFANKQPIKRGTSATQNEVLRSFLLLNQDLIETQYRSTIGNIISDENTVRLIENQMRATDEYQFVNIAITQQVEKRNIAEQVYELIKREQVENISWKAILPLATETRHNRLALVASLIMVANGKQDRATNDVLQNAQTLDKDSAEAVQIVSRRYNVDLMSIIDKHTAPLLAKYIRQEPGNAYLKSLNTEQQVSLVRNLQKKSGDDNLLESYRPILMQEAVEQLEKKQNGNIIGILIGLVGLLVVVIFLVAFFLLTQNDPNAGGGETTPEAEITEPAEATPDAEATSENTEEAPPGVIIEITEEATLENTEEALLPEATSEVTPETTPEATPETTSESNNGASP